MDIVIDTNVIIDGFKDDYSYEKQILDAIISGEIEAYANDQTLRENKLIMGKLINNENYSLEMERLFGQINKVVNRHKINVVSDPEDNKILESAVEAEADYLVTRDNDLLQIGEYEGVKIITPSEFWVKYKDEGGGLWQEWANFFNSKK